jgi:hypothetical protein
VEDPPLMHLLPSLLSKNGFLINELTPHVFLKALSAFIKCRSTFIWKGGLGCEDGWMYDTTQPNVMLVIIKEGPLAFNK